MYKIMIVEDDATITEVLERHLKRWGYQVCTVSDFNSVLEQFEQCQPDLVLMDVSLPFYNGYYWCTEIRKCSQTPILFISSSGDDMNLVMSINLGADDFVAKPFNLEVVLAKIQAILRRTYSFGAEMNVLRYNGVTLNLSNSMVSYGEERLELTKNELKIMQLLIEGRGNTVHRDTIMTNLWESESFVDENTLSVNIARLRKRLEAIGLGDFIVTQKGIGYQARANDGLTV